MKTALALVVLALAACSKEPQPVVPAAEREELKDAVAGMGGPAGAGSFRIPNGAFKAPQARGIPDLPRQARPKRKVMDLAAWYAAGVPATAKDLSGWRSGRVKTAQGWTAALLVGQEAAGAFRLVMQAEPSGSTKPASLYDELSAVEASEVVPKVEAALASGASATDLSHFRKHLGLIIARLPDGGYAYFFRKTAWSLGGVSAD